ncbi:RecQ family ATP-dependent DNA helicase [Dactylosporangium vinaceum]|uniref:ATP-dependent DNA helicase RecQ n=1 Tax=Dactylosporangium vinaceum TaxID=53362 RepID=A0ABV5MN99_9ACTN|nr:ATP-dependent DNA helicase RecQ [Dactylosporangium vinaceum]UAB98559.1 RecQ family ATP-dependent DNA helicase [Dactylosporangium vinaceum]
MSAEELRRVASESFGWERLRDEQLRAMEALMAGRDALAVLPTGAGKSAIYQVPAPLLPGPTIVVSPLLALQQDQISSLTARNHEDLVAVRLSSAEGKTEREEALESLRKGDAEFVFLTPEQFADPARVAQIKALKPSLVAVDEAHCVSAWGHDFRPDYLQLGQFIRELGRPPIVALTATASPPVREDIIDRLGLRDPEVVVMGLDRPNLYLESVHCADEEIRYRRLVSRIQESEMPGIVYAPTRRATEELAERLSQEGLKAVAYHGGMSAGDRERAHEAFLADEVPIMVATTAFGMGIDKPNIRWVNHVSLPDSPDSYLQEIGRAGRDGQPAHVLLLHRTEDTGLRKFFSNVSVDKEEVASLAALLRSAKEPLTRGELEEQTGLGERKLGQLLGLLEEVGGARMLHGGKVKAPRWAPAPAKAAELVEAQAERQQTVSRSRLDMMRNFAETQQCRGRTLLAYFGEHLEGTCEHCDNCTDGSAAEGLAAADEAPFPIHAEVRHGEWGKGVVLSYAGEQMTVLFEQVGYKTLSVPVVKEHRLLRKV